MYRTSAQGPRSPHRPPIKTCRANHNQTPNSNRAPVRKCEVSWHPKQLLKEHACRCQLMDSNRLVRGGSGAASVQVPLYSAASAHLYMDASRQLPTVPALPLPPLHKRKKASRMDSGAK